MWMGRETETLLSVFLSFFPVRASRYILQLMSERLAPSARGGLSLSDGFPVSICQVRLCTARRSPLLSPGYLLPLSPAGSAAAPGPLPTTAQRRGPRPGGSRWTMSGRNGHKVLFEDRLELCFVIWRSNTILRLENGG